MQLDPQEQDLNLLIRETQALSWEDVSRHLVIDPVKVEQKVLISLVGRLAFKKILYKPALLEAIRSAWHFAYDLKIKAGGPNTFIFHFGSPSHKECVLFQSPWNMKGFLLILQMVPFSYHLLYGIFSHRFLGANTWFSYGASVFQECCLHWRLVR